MVKVKGCPFFRRSEGLAMGKGIGYCDLDSGDTTCDGDMDFCERPEALKKYLRSKSEEGEEPEGKA